MKSTIAFIGAGNMARALIGGLASSGSDQRIIATDPDASSRQAIASELGIEAFADNRAAVAEAETVVLAVKPQVIDKVLGELAGAIDPGALVISVAAGIPVSRIRNALGADQPVARAMPNTPALYGVGATGLFVAEGASADHRNQARRLFEAVGIVAEIGDERLMDVVTAVSGSGPAYFFALAEALTRAGTQAGLEPDTARALAEQTAAGAGRMLAESQADAATLRQRVTSPGGTTAAALECLTRGDLDALVRSAVEAAVQRGRELGGDH